MATVTKTIGTSSRDYSTITAWEADLATGSIYNSGDDAIGECYNDSTFSEYVVFNAFYLNSVTLTAANGEKHDGTAGTGVTIQGTSSSAGKVIRTYKTSETYIIEDLDLDSNNYGGDDAAVVDGRGKTTIRRCIVHNLLGSGDSGERYGIYIFEIDDSTSISLYNNIIYDIGRDAGTGNAIIAGIYQNVGTLVDTGKIVSIHNNTIHNIYTAGYNCFGVYFIASAPELHCKNNLVAGLNLSGTSTNANPSDCFNTPSNTTNISNNLSDDATAPGSNSVTNVTLSDQFVSTISGSEDLHLASTSDAIDAGADLGTTPAGVQYDIDGRNRDAENDTWDIGADEFVTVGGGHTRMALMGVG